MAGCITAELVQGFADHLKYDEREPSTIGKYLRDIAAFAKWLGNRELSKELVAEWKEYLIRKKYSPKTVNGMLSAINKFLSFAGWQELRVKYLQVQRQFFRSAGRELSRGEYERLLAAAHTLGKARLTLLMQTICATGIRGSEVKYITVEAVKLGKEDISLKENIRIILFPGRL